MCVCGGGGGGLIGCVHYALYVTAFLSYNVDADVILYVCIIEMVVIFLYPC